MCLPSLSCLHGNQWGAGEGIFLPNEAATCCGSCRRNSVSREQRGHNHRHQRHPPEQNTGRGTGGRRDLHILPEKWKRRDGYLTVLSSQVHSWLNNMGSHTTTCNNTTHKANCILNSIYRGCVRPMVQEHMSSTLSIHLTCGVCIPVPQKVWEVGKQVSGIWATGSSLQANLVQHLLHNKQHHMLPHPISFHRPSITFCTNLLLMNNARLTIQFEICCLKIYVVPDVQYCMANTLFV